MVDTPARHRTIAVASGKGGVGKTVVTANLALGLAQRLSKMDSPVVAIDLDLGCGNLNACLGVRSPNGTVNGFLKGRVSALDHVLSPTEQRNLQMICSSYSGQAEMQLAEHRKQALLEGFHKLDASFVLMDLGAGTSVDVLDLFLAADERILVITPEALSLHNAFVFLKTALLRLINRELKHKSFPATVRESWEEMSSDPEHLHLRAVVDEISLRDPYSGFLLLGLISRLEVRLVVNRYRGGLEQSHLVNFYRLLAKYLGLANNISCLGFVHFDTGISKSIQDVRPFLLHCPESPAAADIRALAKGLYQADNGDRHCFRFPEEQQLPVNPGPAVESWQRNGQTRNGVSGVVNHNGHGLDGSVRPSEPVPLSSPPPYLNGDLPEVAQSLSRHLNRSSAEDILEVAQHLPELN